jgi:hypothetical protein
VGEDVDLVQAERVNKQPGVLGQAFDTVARLPAGATSTGVVEQHNLTVGRQRVCDRRIVVIHVAAEMLDEDQRHTAGAAKPAISNTDRTGLDVLRRHSVVGIRGHAQAPLSAAGAALRPVVRPVRGRAASASPHCHPSQPRLGIRNLTELPSNASLAWPSAKARNAVELRAGDAGKSRANDGVDTFVFRDGKIQAQTIHYTLQRKG